MYGAWCGEAGGKCMNELSKIEASQGGDRLAV